jgi:hypothetical protein
MEIKLNVQADVPTVNGRVYSKEVLQDMITKGPTTVPLLLDQPEDPWNIPLSSSVGLAKNLKLTTEGSLITEIDIFDPKIASLLEEGSSSVTFTTGGYGEVSERNKLGYGNIENFTIQYVMMVTESDFSKE